MTMTTEKCSSCGGVGSQKIGTCMSPLHDIASGYVASPSSQRDETSVTAWEKVLTASVQELKVAAGTPHQHLATAILRYLDEGKRVVLSCIGAQSVSQAMKAVAHAQGESAQQGRLIAVVPGWDSKKFPDRVTLQQVEMTSFRMVCCRLPIVG